MGSHLRVFSGNLMNGRADPQAFAEQVQECGADVVVVQELAPDQAQALSNVFPYGRLEPSRKHTGMGIVLRRPAGFDAVPMAYRDARIARLAPEDWPELQHSLEILNVHISSPTASPLWNQPLRRRRQLRGLIDYLSRSPNRTRAILGDFNATPSWPVYRRMAARFEDLALSHAQRRGARPARTWSRCVGGTPLLRIDHCFAHGVSVEDVEVIEIRGSDHRGLIVDLLMPGETASSDAPRGR